MSRLYRIGTARKNFSGYIRHPRLVVAYSAEVAQYLYGSLSDFIDKCDEKHLNQIEQIRKSEKHRRC